MNTLILEGSLGLDILQEAGQLFVSKPSLQAGDETLGFLGCLRTQVGQGRQLKLVQLLAHQQRSDAGDSLPVAEFGKPVNQSEVSLGSFNQSEVTSVCS